VFDGQERGGSVKCQAMLGATVLATWSSIAAANAPAAVAPRAVLAVAPEYPAIAHQANIAGTVTIRLSVGPHGTVTHASVVEGGHRLLRESALVAARLWEFEPALGDSREAEVAFVYALLPETACFQKTLPRFVPPSRVEVAVRKVVPTCSDCGPSKPLVYEKCE
jgi:TonB family protein